MSEHAAIFASGALSGPQTCQRSDVPDVLFSRARMLPLSGGFGSAIPALYIFSSLHPSVSGGGFDAAARLPTRLDAVSDPPRVPASGGGCLSGVPMTFRLGQLLLLSSRAVKGSLSG